MVAQFSTGILAHFSISIYTFHICGRSIYEKIELSLPYNKSNYDTFARLADNRFTLK